ncbi:cystathionine gamma-synthase family protein [Hyperthermus butylicus]|uniref:Methionine gamma-lyase n=1 Tax=Hyperthermus butylicus (strain DSM 5456 / JCM 9403 / PLM1-5) TaxID=415426 RepID=A2BL10_HYPBU|nr:cystathionine gamma-synthase family protein [Hyperthermus butylicus]ABM80671.1 Methionine gamma-lyase [Hyperthermus butylicus DSM 5456]
MSTRRDSREKGPTTKVIQALSSALGSDPYAPIVTPIYRTAPFMFPREDSPMIRGRPYKYSREDNPTIVTLEKAITILEEGEDTLVFNTGMAAISTLLFALLGPGDRVVATREAYGSTLHLLKELERWGVKVVLAGPDSGDIASEASKPGTKLVFVETITNPLLHVTDVPEVAKAARESGAILVVDNTFATPILFRPLRHGATLVVHSLTKYMAGHNDVMGGSVTGPASIVSDRLWEWRKIMGTTMDPEQAFLVARGLKTLEIRVKRHCENALKIAEFLAEHPKIREVYYPGLPGNPSHSVAKRLFPSGMYGGVVSFRVRGGRNEVLKLMRRLTLVKPSPSLGAPESLLAYPVESSHSSLSPEERKALGITEDLVRLSVGLENYEDIIEDLDQALSAL